MTYVEPLPPGYYWGRCMLYCCRTRIPVKWIGTITIPFGETPMYGCGPCVAELERMAREDISAADQAALVSR